MRTTVAVLSDIHGNLPALEAVLADAERQGASGVIIAGDFIGGPFPQETVARLRALDGWLIRGNGENYFLTHRAAKSPAARRSGEAWAAFRWTYRRLGTATLDWLAALPEQRVVALDGAAPLRVVHGSPASPTEHLVPDGNPAVVSLYREAALLPPDGDPPALAEAVAPVQEPLLICGHSHIPWQQEAAGRLVLNPGSVGAPNNGDPRAHYALLTWEGDRWQATLRAIPYDLDRLRAAYHHRGFLMEGGAFARACLLGAETGRNIPGYFVAHVQTLARQAGIAPEDRVPDDLWNRAVETFFSE